MVQSSSFVTSVQGRGYFNLPSDKQPTNKFLKKKDDDKTLTEKVLGKVFSEYTHEKKEKPTRDLKNEK
ncbi:hypothetical protein EHS13_20210 [Paenibacillus psychroresistens]|uniref:Uncharacterized protein n=1 Tax=Paenibacillus psychroresistens TaxID=1778678 RepID=A0A6B8RND0_9BACL|nr:hypothetical protein [Paenibacillus psychroresistens]QGQ97043.1 hypothetical protein EHS13_20210 [Paenibacillus psychroresistens]